MKLAPGTVLGRYKILAEIGRGGMGVVYRASDPTIDRLVAIKTISLLGADAEEEREYRERFFFEAKAAGRLSHPGIVTIFDVGEEPESHDPYIVMEYVAGESLRKMLAAENKKIPVETALQLTREVALALHYAHSQGVIHRDIKPSNILVTADSHAKIADFGIAKLNLSHLTVPGQLLGSPAYMAPEQLSGEGVDARSDLFSLGVILYTMITGYRPFQGNSATTVCFKVVNRDPIPVTAFDAKLPSEIDQLVLRAMAKDPAERFQSGAEMAATIELFREEQGWVIEDAISGGTGTRSSAIRTATGSRVTRTGSRKMLASNYWREMRDRAYIVVSILFLAASSLVLYRGLMPFVFHGISRQSASSTATPSVPAAKLQGAMGQAAVSQPSVTAQPAAVHTATVVSTPRVALQEVARTSRTGGAEFTTMQLDIQYPFHTADVSVWVDHRIVYSRSLHAEVKKRAFVFHSLQGHQSDRVQVTPGQHRVRVRVQSSKDSYDQSKAISAVFERSGESVLRVRCDKQHGALELTLQ